MLRPWGFYRHSLCLSKRLSTDRTWPNPSHLKDFSMAWTAAMLWELKFDTDILTQGSKSIAAQADRQVHHR